MINETSGNAGATARRLPHHGRTRPRIRAPRYLDSHLASMRAVIFCIGLAITPFKTARWMPLFLGLAGWKGCGIA